MAEHADCSPSSASIWLRCPASITLARGRSRKATPYTREGSAAHLVAELMIHGLKVPGEVEIEGETIEVDDEMVDHVSRYVDYVDTLATRADWFDTEIRVALDQLPEPLFGTADALAIDWREKTIEVVDLKYGRGVPVQALGNPQTRIYGLGALAHAETINPGVIKRVKLTVAQPRLDGSPIVSEELTAGELRFWAVEELHPALEKIADGDETEVPGEHCRWCVRAGECKALASLAQDAARRAFTVKPDAAGMSNSELADALDKADLIVAWVAMVRGEASHRADLGEDIRGWKLVARRSNRKWTSEDDALATISAAGVDLSKVTKILSPAAVERVFKTQSVDMTALLPLITRNSSGTTLVRTGDSRDAVATGAKSVFDVVEDDD